MGRDWIPIARNVFVQKTEWILKNNGCYVTVLEMMNILLKSLLNKNELPNELDLLYESTGNTTVHFILKFLLKSI